MTATKPALRHDIAIFIVALFAWPVFAHLIVLPAHDQVFPVLVLACFAYALAMCKLLTVAPLLRPFIALIPTIAALWVSWTISREAGSFRHDRAILVAQSVSIAALAYLLLTAYRVGRGYFRRAVDWVDREYVFHTPDGGTDGLNTDRLLADYERLRSRLFARRKLRILFPKTGWEEWLRRAFQDTGDRITFAELSPDNIRAHDLVVPLKIPELVELDGLRDLLANSPVPVPTQASIALCDDKYLLNTTLIANGFGAYIPEMGGRLPYPYILKKRSDEWAANSHLIASAEQEREYSLLLDDPEYFRQQYIIGKVEHSTHILIRDRKVVCALSIKFVFSNDLPVRGRECTAAYTKVCRNRHLGVFAAILRSIDFEGLCCVNYKIVDGRPRIFEINPRFGSSLVPWFFTFVRRIA